MANDNTVDLKACNKEIDDIIKKINNSNIDMFNEKILDHLNDKLNVEIYLTKESDIYDCEININLGGSFQKYCVQSTMEGKTLKLLILQDLQIRNKKIKLYHITNSNCNVGDLIFMNGKIGKLITDEELYKQNITPVSFFEIMFKNLR